jgi:hypothetical protein
MVNTLLKILEHGLSIWDKKTEEGKGHYKRFLKNKKEYHNEMDKRSNGKKYSQLAIDRSLRDIEDTAEAYYKFIAQHKD